MFCFEGRKGNRWEKFLDTQIMELCLSLKLVMVHKESELCKILFYLSLYVEVIFAG